MYLATNCGGKGKISITDSKHAEISASVHTQNMSLWHKEGIIAIQHSFVYAPFVALCYISQVISFLSHIISVFL